MDQLVGGELKLINLKNIFHFLLILWVEWMLKKFHLQEYDSDEGSSFADVERFQGKIVYNLDGKAYIIDSENELPLQLNDSNIKGESQTLKFQPPKKLIN